MQRQLSQKNDGGQIHLSFAAVLCLHEIKVAQKDVGWRDFTKN